MNARLHPEQLLGGPVSAQAPMSLETEGVLRYVWHSRFGPMLIEVRQGQAYVNGQRVVPAPPRTSSADEGR